MPKSSISYTELLLFIPSFMNSNNPRGKLRLVVERMFTSIVLNPPQARNPAESNVMFRFTLMRLLSFNLLKKSSLLMLLFMKVVSLSFPYG